MNNIPVKEYSAQNCDVALGSGMVPLFSLQTNTPSRRSLLSASVCSARPENLVNDLVTTLPIISQEISHLFSNISPNDLEIGRQKTTAVTEPSNPPISTKPPLAMGPNALPRRIIPANNPSMVPIDRVVNPLNTNP